MTTKILRFFNFRVVVISAYILIDVKIGYTEKVISALRNIDELELLSVVTGEYDIIIRVTLEDLDSLYQLMINKVDPVEGVNETITSVVEKDFL